MVLVVVVYLGQLSNTVSGNVMSSMDEISRHDVETIEGSLANSYSRLGSVAKRLKVYDVETVQEAQEQLNLEAASSALFNAVYLLADDGSLYSSSYVVLGPDETRYLQIVSEKQDNFVMLYDDENGRLETTKESLVYGIRLTDTVIDGINFVAMLGRSDLSTISGQLLIESFDGKGVSSVVNDKGYYIVSASPATDLAGRNNFYDVLRDGRIDGGMTIDDVRRNIRDGVQFTINVTNSDGERLVMSFAPVAGTSWSFIMTVPMSVFEQRSAPFIAMTGIMLAVMVLVLSGMMLLIYRFMKRSVQARAEATARAEFLSNMSHEIRTPLNGIIGLNHLMERHVGDKEAMEGYVRKLGKAAQYLLSLVNDILDVSKLQAGKVELVNEPFDLPGAVENVCEMQREPMAERSIAFDLDVGPMAFPWVVGDEVRVSQVLMNIISNAVKFTPEGGRITVRAVEGPLNERGFVPVKISVADTGCGMSAEFQKQIFDVFTQERNSNSGSQKGTGLGMSISYLLMQQMGGSLSVESELGHGSCFTVEVELPIDSARHPVGADGRLGPAQTRVRDEGAQSGGAERGTLAEADGGRRSSGLRLLVAEDNELNADIISGILEEEGYRVFVAENGKRAVELFEASEAGGFDAILMDAQMPVMDGYEAAKAIRASSREDAGTVYIFACTASTFTEDRNRAMEAGMNDFLAKPLDVPVMLAKLRALEEGRS